MLSNLQKWVLGIGASLWLFWVIIMYLGYHPRHLILFSDHPYIWLIVSTLIASAGLAYYTHQRLKQKKAWVIPVRGIALIVFFLFTGLMILFQARSVMALNRPSAGSAGIFFLLNSSGYLLLLLVLSAALAAMGHFITQRIGLDKGSKLFDVAVGCSVGIIISTLLGLFGLLYGAVLGGVLLIFVVLERQYVVSVCQTWLTTKHPWKVTRWWDLPVGLIGMIFLGIYWIGGIKAFATGFDGTALYANLAQLIPQYHGLPGAHQAFGWSVVMSWGELLFGSTTFSLLLSQAMYIPALLMAYQLVRKWLQAPYARLLLVLVLSLPMVSFQAMVDEKIDFGLLFISLAVFYQLFQWSDADKAHKSPLAYYLLLGGLVGVGFSIKYTAIFLLVAVVGILSYRSGKSLLLWSSLFVFLGIFFLTGFHEWGNLPVSQLDSHLLGAATLGLGLIGAVFGFRRMEWSVRPFLRALLAVGTAFFLAFLPWGIKHLGEHQYEISLGNFLQGKPERPEISVPPALLSSYFNQSPSGVGTQRNWARFTNDQSQAQQQTQLETAQEKKEILIGNARREELQRYLGYEEGIWRYLSIPFDLTLNLNVSGLRHQEIGFLFLALLPFLFLFSGAGSWWKNSLLFGLIVFWLGSCFWSLTEGGTATAQQEAMAAYLSGYWKAYPELPQGVFYQLWTSLQIPFIGLSALLAPVYDALASWPITVYLPMLLGLIYLLSFVLKHTSASWPKTLKEIAAGLLAFAVVWIILGNSITWYAMLLWSLLPMFFLYEMQQATQQKQEEVPFSESETRKRVGAVIGVGVSIQIILNLGIVLSSSQPMQPAAYIYNWPMLEYLSSSNLSQEKTYRLFDAVSQDICKIINRDKNSKVYRVNTYLNYHIDRNDQRVYEDNQLQYFAELSNRTRSESAFLDVLKINGIDYLLYDINTPSLDQTPEQSLQQKCNSLLNLLLRSQNVEIVLTDNYVAAPEGPVIQLPNGQQAQVRQGLIGQTVYQGRVVLFKIN